MTAETLEKMLSEEKQGEQPKPKRGRPKGSKNSGSGERSPRRPRANLRSQIGNLLRAANFGFVMVASQYAMYQLQEQEVEPLAAALEVEINASPRLQKFLTSAGKISPHIALISIAGQMAITRYQIYQIVKAQGGAAYAGVNRFGGNGANPTVPMETGGTSSDNRGYGNGQDIPGIFTPTEQETSDSPEV